MNSEQTNTPLSVSQLNAHARFLLEEQIGSVWVSGEISGWKPSASGHCYFSLKDDNAQVRCALFKGQASRLDFAPKDGDAVELFGKVTVYEAGGSYQIIVSQMRPTGAGRLYAAFEALKKRLSAEGLFDTAKKRPIPTCPQKIGIVTSPAAAALRDVITTLRRRMPLIELIIYPTAVQGKGSENEIATAIRVANERAEVDTLIVCRGGGSIEDLWAFNEEITVRAVANSALPIVSGVGHETDFTLCDFAADMRAATPTAAAELCSPDKEELLLQINKLEERLQQNIHRRYYDTAQHIDRLERLLLSPQSLLEKQQKRLSDCVLQFSGSLKQRCITAQTAVSHQNDLLSFVRPNLSGSLKKVDDIQITLNQSINNKIKELSQKLDSKEQLLQAVSPQTILQRGFSVVLNKQGKAVVSAQDLADKEIINIRFAQGETKAVVQK
ncbi:MAG: exodeoxyribonuclease VII large subunit [Neisseriaceae bacterium]|nr:exodeoxyribonuclease VII large subunit [Neisseriaceae bacterium]